VGELAGRLRTSEIVARIKLSRPDEDSLARGAKYLSAIDADAWNRGEVIDENDAVRWRYFPRRSAANRGWGNPLRKADFVMQEAAGSGESIIRRTSLVPAVFQVLDDERPIGRIRMLSFLRNRYEIRIDGLNTWEFRMPLFRIDFWGAATSTDIWVHVWKTKRWWSTLLRPGIAGSSDRPLVAALAFIHTEWWSYS
jgi:hypothetical protein